MHARMVRIVNKNKKYLSVVKFRILSVIIVVGSYYERPNHLIGQKLIRPKVNVGGPSITLRSLRSICTPLSVIFSHLDNDLAYVLVREKALLVSIFERPKKSVFCFGARKGTFGLYFWKAKKSVFEFFYAFIFNILPLQFFVY